MVHWDKRLRRAGIVLAWSTLAVLVYMTLGRVGLVYAIYFKLSPWGGHPSVTMYAGAEHVLAFAFLGALLSFAYPRRTVLRCCLLLVGIVVLELLQTLTPDRHGTFIDGCEKIAGGLPGMICARAALRYLRRGAARTVPPTVS